MFLVPAEGGPPRPFQHEFTFSFGPQGGVPIWSPDGKHILFRGSRAGDPQSNDWWVAPVGEGEPVRTQAMANLGIHTIVMFPAAWSGNDVYFVAGTTIEGINIFKTRISPGTWVIGGEAEAVTTGPGMKLAVSVARDGRICFTDMTAMINIWSLAARSDEGEVSGTAERLARDLMQKFWPTLSRDGAKAAFSAFGGIQTARMEIRIMDLRAGTETAIPMRGLNIDKHPRLSPDGTYLAYRDTFEGKKRTYVLGPGAAAGWEICRDCFFHDFFPDNGSALVQTQSNRLERLDLETGEKTLLLDAGRDAVDSACISPEGAWIAWTARLPEGRLALRITPVEPPQGGEQSVITVLEAGYQLGPQAWSPDGSRLYYLSEKYGTCSLFIRQLDPLTKAPVGEEREVYSSPESRFRLNFPHGIGAVAVAEDKILFAVTEIAGNIFMARLKKN